VLPGLIFFIKNALATRRIFINASNGLRADGQLPVGHADVGRQPPGRRAEGPPRPVGRNDRGISGSVFKVQVRHRSRPSGSRISGRLSSPGVVGIRHEGFPEESPERIFCVKSLPDSVLHSGDLLR